MKQHYVDAVTELLLNGSDVSFVLKGLEATLKAKGYISLHAQILKGVQKKLEASSIQALSHVVVTKESDMKHFHAQIEASLKALGGKVDTSNVTIDTTLIGGYIASHQGKSIDASYKNKLVSLYRAITT